MEGSKGRRCEEFRPTLGERTNGGLPLQQEIKIRMQKTSESAEGLESHRQP